MSEYYNPQRTRNLFDPNSEKPFQLSRSKIELFENCPRCFCLDRRFGVGRPPGYPFSLYSAVDTLLKKEFDQYRTQRKTHPLIQQAGLDAIPYEHKDLESWRDSPNAGIKFHHVDSNFIISGGVDDIWVNSDDELIIVDYKATAKNGEVSIDAKWQDGYKRQMSLYSWLFRQNGFKVHPVGYFVYCNGQTGRTQFDGRLDFTIRVIPYSVDETWIEPTIMGARDCLRGNDLPARSEGCDFCRYVEAVNSKN